MNLGAGLFWVCIGCGECVIVLIINTNTLWKQCETLNSQAMHVFACIRACLCAHLHAFCTLIYRRIGLFFCDRRASRCPWFFSTRVWKCFFTLFRAFVPCLQTCSVFKRCTFTPTCTHRYTPKTNHPQINCSKKTIK